MHVLEFGDNGFTGFGCLVCGLVGRFLETLVGCISVPLSAVAAISVAG